MIPAFSFEMPRGLYFGPGVREHLPELIKPLGEKTLVMTGAHWFESSGWKEQFERLLGRNRVFFLHCAPGEPTIESVNDAVESARDFGPDVIVGIGGGSVMDTAKAVSGMIRTGEGVEDYLEGIGKGKTLSRPGIPWVSVPTTSGTGAEVTKNSVIRSKEKRSKKSLRSPFILATYAVIDPELTMTLSRETTGMAGIDALTQLVESYVSKKSKPLTKALVRDAFPRMLQSLKRLAAEPRDLSARTDAAYGALVSGIALANSGLGAAHGFASGLGGESDIPHGLICAVFLGPVLRYNAPAIREQIGELYGLCQKDGRDDPIEWLVGETERLLSDYGLKDSIKKYRIPKTNISQIARSSTGSSMSGNPVEMSLDDRERLLLSVL